MDGPVGTLSRRTRFLGVGLGVVGVALHLAGFFILSLQPASDTTPTQREADLVLADEQRGGFAALIREQARWEDSEPLLLPTRWNATAEPYRFRTPPVSSALLAPFPAELALPEVVPTRSEPTLAETLATPASLLGQYPGWLRGAFQPPPWEPRPPTARSARVEVSHAETGRTVTAFDLAPDALPVSEGELWQPATFLWRLAPLGVVGQPLLRDSSGNTELDQHFRANLTTLPALQALPPGAYTIEVGP